MSEAGAAKAQAGKIGGGNLQAPPSDKPPTWKTLPVMFQYKDSDGVWEYRVVGALPAELKENLHEQHGIGFAVYGEK